MSARRQERPSDAEVLGGKFSRGRRSLNFGQVLQRNPAIHRADATLAGYQNRLFSELANFRSLAQSYGRLKNYARSELLEARRSRFLQLANTFKREVEARRKQEWINRIRTNQIARVLGLPREFEPEEPPLEELPLWRFSKLREWYANEVKKKTPTPYCEIRVYVFTREPDATQWSDRSLEVAMDAVEVWLTTGLASYHITHASENEEVDNDELPQENAHQGRGGVDQIREEQLWYYIAFWSKGPPPRPEHEYYGRVRMAEYGWRADEPRPFRGRKPDFGTPFTALWIPPRR